MLAITGRPQRLCAGLPRRDFLRLGALGAFGLSLPDLLRANDTAPVGPNRFGQAKRCILLYLTGGPPQLDTWDLKPAAPVEYRGELKPIATRVPGMQISELLPRVAQQADKCCVIRSVTHGDNLHTSAGYTMLTGSPHPAANGRSAGEVRPGAQDHPHIGSLLAKVRPSRDGVPVFAALPEIIKDAGVNTYSGLDGGFLGKQFSPFRVEAENDRTRFQVPEVALPADMTAERLQDRRGLLDRLDRRLAAMEAQPTMHDLDAWYRKAFSLIRSAKVREAFALDREPDRLRDEYGPHLFGQGCLLARRLIEAGVGLVSVYWHYEGPDDSPVWDTHQNNFDHLRRRLLPPTDAAIAALLRDLHERGLLDETLVICMGEFGRTPKVNKNAGRDHWGALQSVVLAGGGIKGGSVHGVSDRIGAQPADLPVSPADLTATLMHLLGIPAELEIQDRTNRPLRACDGKPLWSVLG
ncbi:MAG: DUF1501 domain-containing protein [Planctomycetia bacterium]|nr:DUF1501 domain-containing protein [Planctomycetia bacterium]